jgi:serine/threonine-protein kinase
MADPRQDGGNPRARMASMRGDDGRPFDGRYRLLGPLGTGGMATVYLAEDESLGRKVAIKILAERYAEDEQFVERFRREARSAAGLNHPNIVQIYDRGEAEGTYYIAMEHLEGRSLKDIIAAEAPLKPDRTIDISLQILQALRFAHAHGVVHRDIKPHNIILAADGRPKVTDFGIARAGAASQMTEVGSIIGTAQYLSPEQARGQPVQPQADIYSLGVVLYEMLTGRVPFEGDSAVAIAFRHVSEPPTPPSELNPLVPPALEQVVMRALAKDPARRYASADEMSADLERVRHGLAPAAETQAFTEVISDPVPIAAAATAVALPPTAPTRVYAPPPAAATMAEEWAPPPPDAPPPRRRRPLWPWLLVLGLLAAAGAIAAVAVGGLNSDNGGTTASAPLVPNDLVGKTYDQATAELTAKGLKAAQHQVFAPQSPGIVIQATPPGGTQVQAGSTVTLKVSKGLVQVQVPSVVGQSSDQARSTLAGKGFKVGIGATQPSTQPAGTVASQDPTAGQSAGKGTTVHIFLSQGPPQTTVPSVVGQSQSQAQSALTRAGLKWSVTRQSSDTVTSGQVISQRPTGGQVDQGSTVTLVVSSGPKKTPVPDVTGQDANSAAATITAAGFTPQESGTPAPNCDPSEDGLVVNQSPQALVLEPAGATVRFQLCQSGGTGSGNGNGNGNG